MPSTEPLWQLLTPILLCFVTSFPSLSVVISTALHKVLVELDPIIGELVLAVFAWKLGMVNGEGAVYTIGWCFLLLRKYYRSQNG